MTASHGLTRAFISSWLPSAISGSAAYFAGLIVASTMTKTHGTPGWPDPAVVFSIAPAVSLITMSAVLGAAAGWAAARAMVGPVVAIGVFALLLAGYTTLPESLFRIGGATASLLSLTPRSSIQVLQSALYVACAVGVTFVFVRKVDRLPRGRTLYASTATLVAAGLAGVLANVGGMRFSEVGVDVECAGAQPVVCLSPSYEHLRDQVADAVAEPFRRFADAGFEPPGRLTQDFTAASVPGTVSIPTRAVDVYDVQMMLISSLIPAQCDIFGDEATYRDYSDAAYWVESLLGLAVPDNPTVSPAVAGGDTSGARDHVRQIQRRLAACAP
jgi:hypothetical protein